MINKTISIDIPHNIQHFNVFGHFFLDHIFMLYKIKSYLEENNDYEINSIFVPNYDNIIKNNSFKETMDSFYKAVFGNIVKNKPSDCIEIGTIMGSIIDTEEDKLYLAKSQLKINIPKEYLYNGRVNNEINKKYGLKLRHKLLSYFLEDNQTIRDNNEILIIDRRDSRKLLNLNILLNFLKERGFKPITFFMEDLKIREQIKLVNSFNYIITACGSAQVHISFMREDTTYIELCESGFRYPNVAIYGNRYNINTYNLCIPLCESLSKFKFINQASIELNELFSIYPNIINNSKKDIIRENKWYSLLLNKCIDYFGIHSVQDIDCSKYIYLLDSILI